MSCFPAHPAPVRASSAMATLHLLALALALSAAHTAFLSPFRSPSVRRVSVSDAVPRGQPAALAVDHVRALACSQTKDIFSVIITIVDSDPSLLSKKHADNIVTQLCTVIGGTDCVYEKISKFKGSTVMSCAGYIPEGDRTGKRKLRESVASCAFQKAIDEECSNIQDGKAETLRAHALSPFGPLIYPEVPTPSPGVYETPVPLLKPVIDPTLYPSYSPISDPYDAVASGARFFCSVLDTSSSLTRLLSAKAHIDKPSRL